MPNISLERQKSIIIKAGTDVSTAKHLCKTNSARVLQGACEKLPPRAGEHHYTLQNECRKLGPYSRGWFGHGVGDGEGAAIAPRAGGAPGTSTEQAQLLGQRGVGPWRFWAIRCSVGDVALARNHHIPIHHLILTAFCYHEVGCGPQIIF